MRLSRRTLPPACAEGRACRQAAHACLALWAAAGPAAERVRKARPGLRPGLERTSQRCSKQAGCCGSSRAAVPRTPCPGTQAADPQRRPVPAHARQVHARQVRARLPTALRQPALRSCDAPSPRRGAPQSPPRSTCTRSFAQRGQAVDAAACGGGLCIRLPFHLLWDSGQRHHGERGALALTGACRSGPGLSRVAMPAREPCLPDPPSGSTAVQPCT